MSELTAKTAWNVLGRTVLPEQEYTCQKHGAYRGNPLIFLGSILDAQCPECDREKEEEIEKKEKMKEESARKVAEAMLREEKEKHLIEMNIGKKFWDESFDTFNAYTPALKRYLETCIAFANDHQGMMLLMLGENGNGKNHLASSILHKTGGCIYSVFEIELMLKECYSGKREEGESKLYRRLCDVPVLAINEIGKHKIGEWEMNFLSYIINKRYENLMPTILISNAYLKENCPKKGCPDCLQSLLGNDILSRITEDGKIMIFNEKDYRYEKRETRLAKNSGE
jgi:DNA replication protein DnaC